MDIERNESICEVIGLNLEIIRVSFELGISYEKKNLINNLLSEFLECNGKDVLNNLKMYFDDDHAINFLINQIEEKYLYKAL